MYYVQGSHERMHLLTMQRSRGWCLYVCNRTMVDELYSGCFPSPILSQRANTEIHGGGVVTCQHAVYGIRYGFELRRYKSRVLVWGPDRHHILVFSYLIGKPIGRICTREYYSTLQNLCKAPAQAIARGKIHYIA